MTAALLSDITAAGIRLDLTERGTLRYQGDQAAVARYLPEIRAHKGELLAALLTQAANATEDDTPHRLWLITLPDGSRFSASFTPPKTRAEVRALYPEAEIEVEVTR